MEKVLVLGATSAIAMETSKILAGRGAQLFLVGRSEEKLKAVSADLIARGAASAGFMVAELADTGTHEEIVAAAERELSGLSTVLVAYGSLPDQAECEREPQSALQAIGVNFSSVVSLLTIVANRFETAGSGKIAVITSVAGDRGRKSNYIYGSAKGGLSIFLQGLRNRLSSKGVCVLTIKPGFVDTPMTAHMKKGPLFASPQQVASGIVSALDRNRDVVYLPWFWRFIMLVICAIPEKLFKRLSI